MKIEDKEYKEFIRAFSFFVDSEGLDKIAEKYGCSDSYLYQVLNGQKIAGRKTQLKIARACGVDTISEFIMSPKKIKNTKKYPIDIEDPIEWRHFQIIRKFKNKPIACEVNERLVELEALDQMAFIEIIADINKKIKALKKGYQQEVGSSKTASGE